MFYFRNIIFQVTGVGAQNIQTSYQGDLRDTRQIVVKIKKNIWWILTMMLGSLFLAIDTRHNFLTTSLVIIICLTPFSQLQFGLIGCMILIREYVSLTTAAMKMGKRHFYSGHSNGYWDEKMLHWVTLW